VSYPVRVRGLKSEELRIENEVTAVVPRAGTWIEISLT